jgi:hypothetical protein
MKRLGALLLFLVCSLAVGCHPAARSGGRPNVVIVSLDGLDTGSTSVPTLEQLGADGVIFENAFSQSDESLFAQAALLCSQYPSALGPLLPDAFVLRPDQLTLPKILSMNGYKCGGFHGDPALNGQHGFGAGFARFEGDALGGTLESMGEAIISWMTRNAAEGPVFVWAQVEDARKSTGNADRVLGGFVKALASAGFDARNTLFIVTAGCAAKRAGPPALHVPLIAWGCGVTRVGTRARAMVESIDLLPTILDEAGIALPAHVAGQSLREALDGTRGPADRTYAFAEGSRFVAAIVDARLEIVAADAPGGSDAMLKVLSHPAGLATWDVATGRPLPPDPSRIAEAAAHLVAIEQNSVLVKRNTRQQLDPKLAEELRKHGYWDP